MVSRHKITLKMAAQNKLAIIDLLANRGIQLVNRCFLCKSAAESAQHLFFQCSYADGLLCQLKCWMKLNLHSTNICSILCWINARKRRKHWRNRWIGCALGSLVYFIWQERNLRAFEGKERDPQAIFRVIQFTTSSRIFSILPEHVRGEIVEALNFC
ncbi:uncharacterized protein LOC141642901 [Silene latifolia]|uniref:uncharacterized protein LOC141642901 n=1 Tax=Silene latifolia TaxID=37657 RepID=UPI003D783928